MADWYISSAAYAAIPVFQASIVYSVGDIIRPTAPPSTNQFAFRCTVAGTSATAEPNWGGANSNNDPITSGGATFRNVSGQSAYGWSAAAGNLWCMIWSSSNGVRVAIGDRAFLSSDHIETPSSSTYEFDPPAYGGAAVISVNRAGSVPPSAADALPGATIVYSAGTLLLEPVISDYWQGVTFSLAGTSQGVWFANGGTKMHYFKNCAFVFSTSNAGATLSSNDPVKVVFDNTTVTFNNAGQRFAVSYALDITWINTPAALPGTVPTILFNSGSYQQLTVTCRGVDLSAVTTTLCYTGGPGGFSKVLLDSCQIAPSLVRLSTASNANDEVELVNCYDGTRFLAERHTPAGDVTTEFTVTLSGGATDYIGVYSHKMVSSSRADKYAMTLDGFWMDLNLATIGAVRTATVEIISSATLNTDDISLVLEYLGTSGSSLASFVSSLTPITSTAVTASTVTWNSVPATPVKQKLQVTFTPQTIGRVRAQVRLGKANTTCYYNPQVAIT